MESVSSPERNPGQAGEGYSEPKPKSTRTRKYPGKSKKDELSRKLRGDFDIKMAKSKDSAVNSFCSVCRAKNQGLVAMCLRCGHGGHLRHIQEWFKERQGKENRCAIATCNCKCIFSECN